MAVHARAAMMPQRESPPVAWVQSRQSSRQAVPCESDGQVAKAHGLWGDLPAARQHVPGSGHENCNSGWHWLGCVAQALDSATRVEHPQHPQGDEEGAAKCWLAECVSGCPGDPAGLKRLPGEAVKQVPRRQLRRAGREGRREGGKLRALSQQGRGGLGRCEMGGPDHRRSCRPTPAWASGEKACPSAPTIRAQLERWGGAVVGPMCTRVPAAGSPGVNGDVAGHACRRTRLFAPDARSGPARH